MKKIYLILLSILSAAILLSACSGAGDPPSEPMANSSTPQPIVTAAPHNTKTAISETEFIRAINSCGFNFEEDGYSEACDPAEDYGLKATHECYLRHNDDIWILYASFVDKESADNGSSIILEDWELVPIAEETGDNYKLIECKDEVNYDVEFTFFISLVDDTLIILEGPTAYRGELSGILSALGY
mgnify:CR=1 FL=1